MSKASIWLGLRSRGLSETVTAAVMGNMQAESAFRSNNVEDRCDISDELYTSRVDNGSYSRNDFIYDNGKAYGYGLCQWTYWSRKAALYDFAKQRGKSIGDEDMQLDFFFTEGEWKAIANQMNTLSVEDGAKLFMVKHENPADQSESAKNYRARLASAIYREFAGTTITNNDISNNTNAPVASADSSKNTETCNITVRVLHKGYKGRDVFLAQNGINDCGFNCGNPDGDFGNNTESGVKDFQRSCNLEATGVIDKDVWQIIFQ